ncbi:MAG: D-sedoheptulose 7-phosphate isomerase [Sulfurospirillum sp.]|nr:D-sedoheptulose 7-phosphate isomerase [Sulfurospirillum sp.]MBL0703109.1 D-sedoheptulose 7-phosphate isomerase [Sulfurospirillum sp.]
MMNMIQSEMNAHKETIEKTINSMQSHIYTACIIATEVIKNNNKILLFGNGGSAADAQHIAAELSGRYKKERKGLPGIALTTDTSVLTAVSNDYGYDRVFDRQVEALARKGDLLIGISTSGNSKNILRGLSIGKNIGCKTIGLSGHGGGVMSEFCDINLVVPSDDTPRIQEMHIMIGHIICQAIDDSLEE